VTDDNRNRESLLLPILFPVGALAVIVLVLFGFSRILLSVSKHAATAVALVTAAGIMTVAALVASRKRLSGAALFPMVGAMAGIALLAGGLAVVTFPKSESTQAAPISVSLAAPAGAAVKGFSTKDLTFKAGTPTNLTFDNQDPSVPHNVVIFQGNNDKGAQVFSGPLVTGPAQVVYNVPALVAGTYYFHCQVHPTTMFGHLTVSAAGGSSTGGAGPLAITAANLQFSTDKLEMPANVANTLAFTNKDAGTPHNFAIYKDPQYASALFNGAIVTGPATQDYTLPALAPGTYYFKCDIHPTMRGELLVAPAGGGGSGGPSPGGSASASASASASP
jgi:plastocyanin